MFHNSECYQCRINVGAIDAAALCSRNRPTATDENKNGFLYFGCDFSGWYNFRKIIKIYSAPQTT